jgi:hypothetical protein
MNHTITYNLFSSVHDRTIICAIPQDRPVPLFIAGEHWAYDNTVWDAGVLPPGFLPDVAKASSDLNGYYLFYLCRRTLPLVERAALPLRSNTLALLPHQTVPKPPAVAPRHT